MSDVNDELNNPNNPEIDPVDENQEDAQASALSNDVGNEYKEKYEDLQNRYLRLYADYENFKKEVLTQKTQDERRTKKNVIMTTILPLLDHLKLATDYAPKTEDPALAKYLQTVENILKSSFEDIKKVGAEIIIPNPKDAFDQNIMEAIQVLESQEGFEAHSVVKVVSFGLRIEDIVIEPARVIICE